MLSNVGTFLWRTLYLQGVRRHGIATLIELLIVAGFFYFLSYSQTQPEPLSKESEEKEASSALTAPSKVTDIVYAPDSDYNEKLMKAVADEIYRLVTSRRIGPERKQSRSYLYRAREGILDVDAFIPADSDEHHKGSDVLVNAYKKAKLVPLQDEHAVVQECKSMLNNTRIFGDRREPLCLALNKTNESAGFVLRLFAPVSMLSEEMYDFRLGSSKAEYAFVQATTFQHIIQQEHLKLQSMEFSNVKMDYKLTTARLPGWVFDGCTARYAQQLQAALSLVFLIPLVRRINAIQYEFSTGTADHQGVMGLSDAEFFWGHYLTCFLIGIVESLSAALMMLQAKYQGSTFAHGIDPSLLIVSFIIFQIGFSLVPILLTWVFPKGWLAFIAALLLTVYVPGIASHSANAITLPDYFLQTKKSKLMASIIPHSALYCVLRIMLIARDYEGSASWSLVNRRVLHKDSITIAEIWAWMLLCDVAMAFLAWYLSRVLPWSTNNRLSPLFCFYPSYWNPEDNANTAGMLNMNKDPARFEEMPPGSKVIIDVNGLTKVFGYKPALSGVDLKVYSSRITVLLGHNGAGKTTLMSILTGMLSPTSGKASVCGYDVSTQRQNVRRRVSFCQQTDIFFDDLTCAENVLYFGSLKGAKRSKLAQSVTETLCLVGIGDKADRMPKELSGGMKRRLSMAMTLVSEPDLLILDEPSAGMDPETRRNVWDVLQKVAKQRTLLLSSHDMEEADAIADQIVIMASGVVVCTGSTTFLKKACGVGYKVTFTKVPQVFKLHDAMAVVKRTIPHAIVDDDKKEEVCIALGTMENENFPGMFRMLEGSMKRLGISSIGVSVASMKDVYLKINMDWAPGGKDREDPVDEKVIEAVSKPISKQRTMRRSFSALLYKRLLSLVRSWDLYLVFFLGPLVLLALATWLRPQQSLLKTLKNQEETLDVPIKLSTHFPDSTVVLGEAPATNLSKALRVLIESESCTVRATGNVTKELHEIIEDDFAAYILTYPMAVAFQSNTIRMMPNPTSAITSPIIINLVHTAWLRVLAAQPTLQNNITVTYLVAVPFEPLLALFIERVVGWLYWVIVAALTYTMSFAAYASFPVDERLGGARDVQLMTGISGTEFIFAHFVFDFACHFLYCVSWCTIHYAFSFYSLGTAALLFGALLSFGPVAIGVCYVKAEYSSASGSSVASVFLWFYIGGAIVTAASTFFVLLGWPEYTQVLLYGVPPYALLSLLNKIWNNEDKSLQCKELQKEGIKLPRGIGPNCDEGLLQLSTDGVGFELAFLLAEGLFFLAYMIFKTSGYLSAGDPSPGDEAAADEDVAEEAKKVEAAVQKNDYVSNSMLVWRLHKHFGALHAVRGIYMALRPSECFGLLGVNGAGKTTTFQMLAALISVSYGDASTAVAKLSANARRWQSQVSYCFQLGGLLDRLNAYEYLYLVGRLRGITESDLKPMVDSVIAVVDLTEHASKQCGVYSGGNRRKLSIGAALLGLQPFIFLDEPYAGVDVVSRNKIFRAIAEIKKRSKSTFVLTSHNMDECEFSCDRITIMVEGHMMCLGTLQHLREKFGKGFRLEFLLKHTAAADAPMLNAAVQQLFRGIELKQCHQNLLCYHLAVRVPWSEIFTKVVNLQKSFQLEHALVAENTLEDIFLNFAKAQEAATMAATGNAAPPTAHPRQPHSTGAPASAAASTSPA